MAFVHNTNNHNSKRRTGKYEPIYASSAALVSLSKDKLPDNQQDPEIIYNLIKDELLLDGNAKQNLATFCQTWSSPHVHTVMDLCINKNMIDKDEYPQTAEIENRCVHILANLWNSPSASETIGCSTVGSSEAAMLGGLAMKWRWKKKREKEGKPADKPNLICGAVQVCWHKFAKYFDVELREIPVAEDKISMIPEDVIKYCDENTIGVVPTLGVTFTCMFEDVQAISKALDKLQKEKGWDIPIHVDAASGGFIAPFVYPKLNWDFRLKRVKSINASGHKYGLSPLGVGWVIWREKQDLPEDLIFTVDYLGGNMPTFALNFSRPGGQVIVQYYNFMRLGIEGYKNITQACMDHAQYIGKEIKKIKLHGKNLFTLFYEGKGGLPAVSWRLNPAVDVNFTLYDLSERLRLRGWQVPAYPLPPKLNNVIIQRILVRQGFSKDMADLLLDDFRSAIEQCVNHPIELSTKKTPFSHI